ncbi:MAG: hypothetical protein VB101_12350 [Rhodospirillaceae bacterium]|nr:hypothetical protein [Rhodospirillaceae bacterium]
MSTDPPSGGIAKEDGDSYALFSARMAGTNINAQTLLATDFLNHFSEVVMLIEMIPDMPDCFEEVLEWQPKSYLDHFRDSHFPDRDLAMAAYEAVPDRYKTPFEDIVTQMNALVVVSVERIGACLEQGGEGLRDLCQEASRNLQKMMDIANAIINGSSKTFAQGEIDELMGF